MLYLAPWVDVGGADKGTIDWFRFLDRSRFAASLITTQPSPNRRIDEVAEYAEEVWELPQLMSGDDFPRFISDFIESRSIKLVHIMNSRLGFELLPTIATLRFRPRVVVQLHVEEPDRSGYVRYVTTRYGNLVDAFSLSSDALSRRLAVYEIPRAKRRVIRTGVDAHREFNRARVRPVEGLDPSALQIVFPARLHAQKDPLLMVEVAARLRSTDVSFQIHVLGDGDLAEPVRERVASLGLEREVMMHGDTLEAASWYAASDVAMLTSKFEGLPYVAYEAMAMEVPIVAPRLPGLDELVTSDSGVLVSPPDDPEAYAAALAALAVDPPRRRRMGKAGRSRVVEFSLERMASEHAALYEELLSEDRQPRRHRSSSPNGRVYGKHSPRVAFRGRRPGSRPLVSVIVPCFNHGTYLPECLASVGCQLYPKIETIVADDGSTDPDTHVVLDRIERDRIASVVRLPTNCGPGAARNVAVDHAAGRYVLPLDADNVLFPYAIADLVEQLNNAGEQIGFIYPNLQFFGNRQDYLEAPSYNLHSLLAGNFCDTASLIDREVFDCGLRYSEYAGLIHEDWEFVLALAERGIYGQPARKPTLRYRKRGFTRSDLVNLVSCSDAETRARHSRLFAEYDRIKAEWSPSLTVIALDHVSGSETEAVPKLIDASHRQTCGDFELIIRTPSEVWPTSLGPRLRRVPIAHAGSRAEALAQGTMLARGRFVMACYGSVTTLLADRAMVEKLLRVLQSERDLGAIGLADAGAAYSQLRLLHPDDVNRATLGAFCWKLTEAESSPTFDPLPPDQPLETLARCLGFRTRVQWRHVAPTDMRSLTPAQPPLEATPRRSGNRAEVVLREPGHPRQADALVLRRSVTEPGRERAPAGRLGAPEPWMPPQTRLLCRHVHERSGRYTYTDRTEPPAECALSRVLGSVRTLPLPGTTPIALAPDGAPLVGEAASLDDRALLGFIEQAPLPLLDEVSLGYHRRTGQWVLTAGASDPLAAALGDLQPLGFIEPYPIHPQAPPHLEASFDLIGLVRTADQIARRHRYGAGRMPRGVFAGELGALLRSPADDRDPLWVDDEGSCFPVRHSLSNGRPSLISSLRWTAAPLTWTNFGRPTPKLRSTARRALDSTRLLASTSMHSEPPAAPAGYLLRSPTTYTVPLYAALHPVTGDQLLSSSRSEATSLGYQDPVLLGHLVAWAPVTGRLGPIRAAAPWTTRFGMVEVGS